MSKNNGSPNKDVAEKRARTIATVAFLKSQYGKAVEAYDEYLQQFENDAFLVSVNKCACYLELKQYPDVITAGYEALRRRRAREINLAAKLFYRMGRAYQEVGERAQAMSMYRRSLHCCWTEPVHQLYTDLATAELTNFSIPPLIPCRRKLFDRGMESFSLGNTAAINVFHDSDILHIPTESKSDDDSSRTGQPVRVLFIGVGDVRNPLSFLQDVPPHQPVEIHMNDLAVATLARDLILLKICNSETVHDFVSIWCNGLLSSSQHALLQSIITELIEQMQAVCESANGAFSVEVAFAPWLVIHATVSYLQDLINQLNMWRCCSLTHEQLGGIRFKCFRQAYALANGVTYTWLQYGLAYLEHLRQEDGSLMMGEALSECTKDWIANPTLMDFNTLDWLDTQGPFNAFLSTQQYAKEVRTYDGPESQEVRLSNALRDGWTPLVATIKERLQDGNVMFHVWPGDGASLLEHPNICPYGMPSELRFDAIDTSNVSDYIGVWTLLLPALERLNQQHDHAFVQVQHMIHTQGVHQFLYDQSLVENRYVRFFEVLGLQHKTIRNPANPKDDWPYIRFTKVTTPSDASDEEIMELLQTSFLASITHLTLPKTVKPHTMDPFEAFRLGWTYSAYTCCTWLRMLRYIYLQLPQYRHVVVAVLNFLLSDQTIWDNNAGGKLRRMEFEIMLYLENWRLQQVFNEELPFDKKLLTWIRPSTESDTPLLAGPTADAGIIMVQFDIQQNYDLDGLRGGIFEPALCCICVRGSQARNAAMTASTSIDETLPPHVRTSQEYVGMELFKYLNKCSPRDVQILDSVMYNTTSRAALVYIPSHTLEGNKAFTHLLLADVQRSEIIAAAVPVTNCRRITLSSETEMQSS